MLVKQIIEILEKAAPPEYSADWDNVGLMIGSINDDVNSVMLTLDITPGVVAEAIENKCDMIISHHPLFFETNKSIDFDTPKGKMVKDLIKYDIVVYSSHTNMDAAEEGINSVLAEMFKLKNITVLQPHEKHSHVGIGRVGNLEKPSTLAELCKTTKKLLNTPFLRVVTDDVNVKISKVCVASGSCGDLIILAKSKGADVIITADVKYHQALEAADNSIAVIDAGHFPTENMVVEIFQKLLSNTGLKICCSNQMDVFETI